MSWTATATNIQKADGKAYITISLTNGTITLTKIYTLDFTTGDGSPLAYQIWLKQQIYRWALDLDQISAAADSIPQGAIINFITTPPVVDPDYTTALADVTLIRRLINLTNVGVALGTSGTTALANAKTELSGILQAHPEWLSLADLINRG